ncbi:group 1 family glycosyl transferase [Caballeronia hypogeia]|uniref:Group 1 family glycosyl transferase n=1 Tax=Caballeronia hypogeia TaxID=1777140 RepID=A0A158CDU1_9BURK|nr:glycosyltransferase family 4 protein [Caballeronia hypogeia]SAK80479.1 group 1 family glycosyl transferase [Caballeronia hypogeia]
MNIVIFIYSMQCGGAQRVTANLANEWASRAIDVTIVTEVSPEQDFYPLEGSIKRLHMPIAARGGGLLGALGGLTANFARVREYRRILKQVKPDIALGMMTAASVLSILAGRGLPCKVVATEHTHPPILPSKLWSTLRRWVFPSADRIVVLTEESKVWLREHCDCSAVSVIPPPFALPIPRTEPMIMPETVMAPERRMLLAVGRLHEAKGFDYLVDAFAEIAPGLPQWDLVIVGEGDQRALLEKKVAQHGLQGRVKLPGHAGNVRDWYQRADLYVLSSRFEGFSMTLVEAMSAGVAAVSYDCDCGPRDIIRHGENGLLVRPVGDPHALAQALGRLMENDAERAAIAARATGVTQTFAFDKTVAMWSDVFSAVGVKARPGLA